MFGCRARCWPIVRITDRTGPDRLGSCGCRLLEAASQRL
jgi:hypothetical protein